MSKENLNYYTKETLLSGDVILATSEGLSLLDQRIKDLESELIVTTQAMGESANNDKDLRENYDFRDLRIKATDELPKKIVELRSKRSKSINFTDKESSGDLINFGDKFVLELYFPNEPVPEVAKFHLVGPIEVELSVASSNNIDENTEDFQQVSYLSPLGSVLWGGSSKEGTSFKYKVGRDDVKCVFLGKKY